MKNFLSILLIVSLFSFETFAQNPCDFETFSPNISSSHGANNLLGQSIVLNSTTTIYRIIQYVSSGNPTGQFAIYSDNAGSPNTLLGYTNGSTLSTGYNDIPLTSPLTLSAGTYWLMAVWSGTAILSQDNTNTKTTMYRTLTYGTALPTSFGTATSYAANKYSRTFFVCSSPEVNLKGNSTTIVSGDAAPSLVDHTDFGAVYLTSGTQVRTFTIENLGIVDLTLTSSPKVTITGTNAADFSVTTQPTSPVTPSGSTAFQITFYPSAGGTRSAIVTIANNDSNENPYTFAIQGTGISSCEVETLSSNSTGVQLTNNLLGQSIVLGSTTTIYKIIQNINTGNPTGQFAIYSDNSGSPNTLLGYTNGSTLNTGYNEIPLTSPLTLSAGTYWLMSVWSTLASLSQDNGVTKTTQYRALTYGTTLPTTFGAATSFSTGKYSRTFFQCPSPEINLKGNSTSIINGDATPSTADHTDFGAANQDFSTQVRTFTIENLGTADLVLLGSPKVTITGTNASDFSVTTQPTSPVTALVSTTFQVRFAPSAGGTRSATVNITNNDSDENPYTFAIQGTGVATTRLSLASSANPSIVGNTITFTATLTSNSVPLNGYNVTLNIGGASSYTSLTNSSGVATFAVSSLTFGIYSVTAFFGGSSTQYLASLSNPVSQLVNPIGSPFITRWNLVTAGSGVRQLTFGIGTSGTVNYSWQEVGGAGTKGTGSLSGTVASITGLPTGSTIDLSIFPSNFQRFYINNGTDKSRLIDIKKWGDVAWGSKANAFYGCNNLNITATDVPNLSSVSDMSGMFVNCSTLNGPTNINSWNTSTVTSMQGMFFQASAFNQPIDSWNISAVRNMQFMFLGANSFNQPIGNWNISAVTSMSAMFSVAYSFNQSLAAWGTKLNANVDLSDMLHNSGMSVANYDATLTGFNAGTITGRNLGAGGLKYCASAADRANLIIVKGWTISGDSFVTPNPTVTPNPSICFNSSASLSANCANGNVAWYDSNSSTLLATTPIYITPNLTTNTTYTVRCESGTPPDGGCNSGFVSINVSVGPAASLPEINLQGNANTIPDGDNTPTASDNTDFSILNMSSNLERTFTIQNIGSGPLNIPLGGINLTGADASLFSIGGITLPITIASSGSATFTLTFAPGTAGFKTAMVNIVNDDCDENEYNFAVQGTGTPGCGSITLTNSINPGSSITYTELEITASNQVSNALVTYQASTSITLLPGFSATGNTFIAKIGGCSN